MDMKDIDWYHAKTFKIHAFYRMKAAENEFYIVKKIHF